MKKFLFFALVLFFCGCSISTPHQRTESQTVKQVTPKPTLSDSPLNASYIIDGKFFALTNGQVTQPIPDMAIHYIVTLTGNPLLGDLNNDATEDAAVILTQEVEKGVGKYFYISSALRDPETKKFLGINSVFLGDRVTVDEFKLENGVISVSYRTMKNPEVIVSKQFIVDNVFLKEKK